MRPTEPREPGHARVAYERRDIRLSYPVGFAAGLVVLSLVILLAMWGLFRFFAAQSRGEQVALDPGVAASLRRTPPEPRLEPLPLAPRQALRAAEDARLTTYGWVDRSGGIARIPIDRAMQMIVQKGVPGGKPFPPAPTELPGAPSESNDR